MYAVALKIVFLFISYSWNRNSLKITENGKGDCKLLLIGVELWRCFSLVSSSWSISCSLSLTSIELNLGALQSLLLEQGELLGHIWSQEFGGDVCIFLYMLVTLQLKATHSAQPRTHLIAAFAPWLGLGNDLRTTFELLSRCHH